MTNRVKDAGVIMKKQIVVIIVYWLIVMGGVVLVLVSAGTAKAQCNGPWSSVDTALLTASTAVRLIDYGQTRTVLRQPERWREMNPLIGKHPSIGRIERHFAVAIIGTALLACALPPEYRRWHLGLDIVTTGAVISHNHSIGIRVQYNY